MNQFSKISKKLLINYRILKSPLEVIKHDEHKMTWIEYKIVLNQLLENLTSLFNTLDNIDDPSQFMIIEKYYVDRDHKIRCVIFDKYRQTYEDIHNAFLKGMIVCSNYIGGNKNEKVYINRTQRI